MSNNKLEVPIGEKVMLTKEENSKSFLQKTLKYKDFINLQLCLFVV